MAILAFDTSLGAVSVALRLRQADGTWRTVEAFEACRSGHAERLMPMIAEVLARAGADFTRVQRIAVTLGPGTFTGVRTGIAAARAFRLASGAEIVGVTSLAAIAFRAMATVERKESAGAPVLVALDARRDRVYAQLFPADALSPAGEPAELTPLEAIELLPPGATALAVGSGARLVAEAARDRGRTIEVGAEGIEPHAADVAELALGLAPLTEVVPLYIRPPDAKPQVGKSVARAS